MEGTRQHSSEGNVSKSVTELRVSPFKTTRNKAQSCPENLESKDIAKSCYPLPSSDQINDSKPKKTKESISAQPLTVSSDVKEIQKHPLTSVVYKSMPTLSKSASCSPKKSGSLSWPLLARNESYDCLSSTRHETNAKWKPIQKKKKASKHRSFIHNRFNSSKIKKLRSDKKRSKSTDYVFPSLSKSSSNSTVS